MQQGGLWAVGWIVLGRVCMSPFIAQNGGVCLKWLSNWTFAIQNFQFFPLEPLLVSPQPAQPSRLGPLPRSSGDPEFFFLNCFLFLHEDPAPV